MLTTGLRPWLDHGNRPKKPTNQSPWMVIHDPSGDFLWRCFRSVDLQRRYSHCWPDGIIFWNTRRGEVRIWQNGCYRTLTPARGESA